MGKYLLVYYAGKGTRFWHLRQSSMLNFNDFFPISVSEKKGLSMEDDGDGIFILFLFTVFYYRY